MAVRSRRADHAQDTRAALLQAARELLAQKGYAGTGTEEIAGRASGQAACPGAGSGPRRASSSAAGERPGADRG